MGVCVKLAHAHEQRPISAVIFRAYDAENKGALSSGALAALLATTMWMAEVFAVSSEKVRPVRLGARNWPLTLASLPQMSEFVQKVSGESAGLTLEAWVSAALGSDAVLTVISSNSSNQSRTFSKSFYVPTAEHFVSDKRQNPQCFLLATHQLVRTEKWRARHLTKSVICNYCQVTIPLGVQISVCQGRSLITLTYAPTHARSLVHP